MVKYGITIFSIVWRHSIKIKWPNRSPENIRAGTEKFAKQVIVLNHFMMQCMQDCKILWYLFTFYNKFWKFCEMWLILSYHWGKISRKVNTKQLKSFFIYFKYLTMYRKFTAYCMPTNISTLNTIVLAYLRIFATNSYQSHPAPHYSTFYSFHNALLQVINTVDHT